MHAAVGGSCARLLARVDRHLPAELADASARRRLHAAAAAYPAGIATSLWLECRLGAGAGRVDLSLKLRPSALALLPIVVPGGAGEPAWARVRALTRARLHPGGALRRGAAGVWLEHDLHPGTGARPAPSVFVQMTGEGPDPARDAWWEMAGEALDALLDGAPAPLLAHLLHCRRSLPRGARAPQLGVMLSRGERSVRFCAYFAAQSQIPPFLEAVRWPGLPAELGARIGRLRPEGGPAMLHLDLGPEGPRSRAGVDLPVRLDGRAGAGPREREMLERLALQGLAEPRTVEALLRWPGARAGGGGRRMAARALSHLKLVHRPGSLPEMKAYLTVRSAPRVTPTPGHTPRDHGPGAREETPCR